MKVADVKLAIVIPVFNCADYTLMCIDSIYRFKTNLNLKVILVDNGSTKVDFEKVNFLVNYLTEKKSIEILLIKSEVNLGFAGGTNLGLKNAFEDQSVTHICLLNNDTVVSDFSLDKLVALSQDAFVGPVSNSVGNEQIVRPFFESLGLNGYTTNLINDYASYRSRHFANDIISTEMLGFFCVVSTKKLFQEIGYLDEQFGLGYYEDDDYCHRIKLKKYKLIVDRSAYVHHFGSTSFKALSDFNFKKQFSKNKEVFRKKHGILPYTPLFNTYDLAFNLEMSWIKNREIPLDRYNHLLTLWGKQSFYNIAFKSKLKEVVHIFISKIKVLRVCKNLLTKLKVGINNPRKILSLIKTKFYLKIKSMLFSSIIFSQYFSKQKKTIIILPIQSYFGRKQRPYHLANEFSKLGHAVIWIEPVINNYSNDQVVLLENGVCLFTPSQTDFNNFYNSSISNAQKVYDEVNKFLISHNLSLKDAHVIVQSSFWGPLYALDYNQKIFDCMDLHAGMGSSTLCVEALERKILLDSSKVVVSSEYLATKVKEFYSFHGIENRHVEVIKNGCCTNDFPEVPIIKHSRLTLGYFGAIAEWFDLDLIIEAALLMPEWSFELIGGTCFSGVEKKNLPQNIKLFGEIPYEKLQNYTKNWNVALIPFKLTELILATNPVKMYEYSSLGLPIVSTAIPEVMSADITTYIASDVRSFIDNVKKAVNEDTKEMRSMRANYAHKNSWNARALLFDSKI